MTRCYAFGPDCYGALQRHHIVKRQRIRATWRSLKSAERRGGPKPWSVTRAIADERNLVWTCVRHHKEETAMPLPDGFWAFVAEYDLSPALPRYLACGAAVHATTLSGQGTVASTPQSPREDSA